MNELEEKALILEEKLEQSLTDLLDCLTSEPEELQQITQARALAVRVRDLRTQRDAVMFNIILARMEEPDEDYTLPF